jgi:hypothetical protein
MQDQDTPSSSIAAAGSEVSVAGRSAPVTGAGSVPASAPSRPEATWTDWIFHLLFDK